MKRMTMALLAVTVAVLAGSPAVADDEQVAKTIIQRLQQQKQAAGLEGFNIGVQVEQGTVTMMGTVAESDHALMALDVARRVPGVKLVVNDLFVQPTSGPAPPDPDPQSVIPTAAEQPVATKSTATSAPSAGPIAGLEPPTVGVHVPQISGTQAGFVPQMPPSIGAGAPGLAAATPSRAASQQPLAFAPAAGMHARPVSYHAAPEYGQAMPAQYAMGGGNPTPMPMNAVPSGIAQATYDNPQVPGYAWPSYAAYPNYAAVSYPHQYSPTAWPYIGPFYPYPQVPLGWRKVTLEWDDGWWFLDFKSK